MQFSECVKIEDVEVSAKEVPVVFVECLGGRPGECPGAGAADAAPRCSGPPPRSSLGDGRENIHSH